MDCNAALASFPTVYAVGEDYQIIVPVTEETVMWVEVGGKNYYDDVNGILRSDTRTHKICVPGDALDGARSYTVCLRKVNERKPYFSDLGEEMRFSVPFRPVRGEELHFYQIADAHNRVESPILAAKNCGEALDFLILNGDIPNHSGDIRNFAAIHRIAGEITRGEIPVIFSRGNHDTRGIYAEHLAEHTPTDGGRSYYTVRMGPIWALVLDCAEDKTDDHAEYGHTVCCHDFRLRETEFLKRVASDPEHEYAAPGVKHRLVIVHNPFSETLPPPFDIEKELYGEWCAILKETIRPGLMLCGHIHKCYVTLPGTERDHKGAPCPVVVASIPGKTAEEFIGGAVTLTENGAVVRFTDQDGNETGREEVPFGGR